MKRPCRLFQSAYLVTLKLLPAPIQLPAQGPLLRRQRPRRCHVRDHVVRPSVSHPANLPWDPGRREGVDRRRISDGIVTRREFTERRRVPKFSAE